MRLRHDDVFRRLGFALAVLSIHSRDRYRRLYLPMQRLVDGEEIPWEVAKEKAGFAGPSTWYLGDYPDGEDNYPVRGVSWYEAAAYAAWAGAELPTIHHWRLAVPRSISSAQVPASNLNVAGPKGRAAPVGQFNAPGIFGAYGMNSTPMIPSSLSPKWWNESRRSIVVRRRAVAIEHENRAEAAASQRASQIHVNRAQCLGPYRVGTRERSETTEVLWRTYCQWEHGELEHSTAMRASAPGEAFGLVDELICRQWFISASLGFA